MLEDLAGPQTTRHRDRDRAPPLPPRLARDPTHGHNRRLRRAAQRGLLQRAPASERAGRRGRRRVGRPRPHWNLGAHRHGRGERETGALEISADALTITIGGATLSYSTNGSSASFSYGRGSKPRALTAARAPEMVVRDRADVGGRHVDVLRSEESRTTCSLTIATASHSFSCSDEVFGWPRALPAPLPNVRYAMTRDEEARVELRRPRRGVDHLLVKAGLGAPPRSLRTR